MKNRIEALNRLCKLQARMHELARSRLSTIERQQAKLGEDLRGVFAILELGSLALGAQAKLTAPRIRSLQKRLDLLARESETVREAAKAHGLRAKLIEKAAESAARAYREVKERKELADLIDRALARRDASST
jgi:hypothetical protein